MFTFSDDLPGSSGPIGRVGCLWVGLSPPEPMHSGKCDVVKVILWNVKFLFSKGFLASSMFSLLASVTLVKIRLSLISLVCSPILFHSAVFYMLRLAVFVWIISVHHFYVLCLWTILFSSETLERRLTTISFLPSLSSVLSSCSILLALCCYVLYLTVLGSHL